MATCSAAWCVLSQQDWIEESLQDRHDDVRSSPQFVPEAVNQLDSPAHSLKLRSVLGDKRADSDSLAAAGCEFILVSGECHARAGELRDSLSLEPPPNTA